ncbi:MAG: nitroreductase family protein [Ruminococcaceae bacterium]|nr:nitroreductase family protein [Oscillospiraceae bacterium]
MNDTIRSILDRRSIRAYKPDPLTEEQLRVLEECALASPTAVNAQSWHFTFVTDTGIIDDVDHAVMEAFAANGDTATVERVKSRGGTVFYKAPLAVFISCDRDSKWGEVDAGIAVENLALAAHSLGLGSVIIGMCAAAFKGAEAERLEKLLKFPENHRFAIAIAIGAPDTTKEAHPIHEGRLCRI